MDKPPWVDTAVPRASVAERCWDLWQESKNLYQVSLLHLYLQGPVGARVVSPFSFSKCRLAGGNIRGTSSLCIATLVKIWDKFVLIFFFPGVITVFVASFFVTFVIGGIPEDRMQASVSNKPAIWAGLTDWWVHISHQTCICFDKLCCEFMCPWSGVPEWLAG